MNKEYIIKKNQEFNNIIKTGDEIKNKYLKVYFCKNQLSHIRFGISVPKKIGNAVLRNKIKRQVKEILRFDLPSYKNINNDYVIIINKSFINLIFDDKIKVINKLIKEELKK